MIEIRERDYIEMSKCCYHLRHAVGILLQLKTDRVLADRIRALEEDIHTFMTSCHVLRGSHDR